MNESGSIPQPALVAIGSILIGIGFFVFASEGSIPSIGVLLVGVSFLLVGAIFLAFPLSQWISSKAGGLFYPDEKFRRAPPLYSQAEALAKMDHFDESMAAYEKIAEAYPDELKPFVDMIEIAIMHYRDPERANGIYQRGIAGLQNSDDRDTLSRMYRGIRSRIEEEKDWQRTRTLHLDP